MALKLVSNEDDRRFYIVDEMGRTWASPYTVRSQENYPMCRATIRSRIEMSCVLAVP